MLTPRKKMTRKELHKDPLMQKVAAVTDYAQANRDRLMYVVGGIAALVVAVYVYFNYRSTLDTESINRLSTPERIFFSGDYREAIKRLEKYCAEYEGTQGGGIGTVSYYQTDQFDFALSNYRIYVDDYGDQEVYAAASMAGMAACYEALNQHLEAADQYEKVIAKYPDFFQRPGYMIHLARCFKNLGDNVTAKAWLDRVVKEYPESSYARDARNAIDEMGV